MTLRPIQSKARGSIQAFSLAEVMCGMAVMMIVVLAMYAGISSAFGIMESARQGLRATQIQTEVMEVIRLYKWDEIQTNNFGGTVSNNIITLQDQYYNVNDASSMPYHVKMIWEDAPFSASYTNDIRKLTVQVSWNQHGRWRTNEMQTLVSRYGLQGYVF